MADDMASNNVIMQRMATQLISVCILEHSLSQSSKNETPVSNSAVKQAGVLKDYLRKSKEKVVRHQNLASLLWFTVKNSVYFEIPNPKTKLNLHLGTTAPSLITLSEYIAL